jgi:hypothetical protein
MRSSRLATVLLATAVALSACKGEPPSPPAGGEPTLADATLAETTVGASYASSLSVSGGTAPYTFSAQGLPPGIALASDSGALSGTASAAGDFQVQVTAKDANGKQASKTFPLKVYPPVSFKQSALPAPTAESPYSVTLELEGGKAPLTLKLATGALPAGVNFNPNSQQLAGTFPSAGSVALTFEATDVHGAKATQSYALTVAAPLRITLSSVPAGNVGAPYSEPITTSGGRGPFTASLESGTLPPGLSFSGDALAGTPTAAGHFTFVLKVADANGATATLSTAMDIYSSPPPRLTTTSLPNGLVGNAYSQTLVGADGVPPYAFAVTFGVLPAGLQLSANGALSGTPTTGGSQSFEVTLTDSRGQKARRTFTLGIYPVLALQSGAQADGYQGRAYSQLLATRGTAPYTFAVQSGTVPPGLTLTNAGELSGTPSATGSYSFSGTLSDASGQSVSGTISLTVYAPPSITTSYADGYTSDPYSGSISVTGGKTPFGWSVATGALPDGLGLSPTTGLLAGTPTQAGTFPFTLRARDANGEEATRSMQVVIYVLPTVTSASPLPSAYAGQPYSTPLTSTGGKGTLTFSLASGALPTGLTLTATGTIGSLVNAGVAHATKSTFTVRVQDSNGKGTSQPLEITTYKVPQITSTALTPATEGVDYRRSEASTERVQAQFGQGTLAFSATGLPPGLSFNTATGELTGTPAQGSAGAYSVSFGVTDAGNQSASKTLTLQVVTPQPTRYGGIVGLAPEGGRLTDTLTVFVNNGRLPVANVGVRVRKNGQEYSPPKEALTNAEGKVVFTGLGLNGTTDTADITGNGKELVNATLAGVNASVVTLRMFSIPVPGPRVSSSGAYDPSSRRFVLTSGYDSNTSNSLFYTSCLNDMVEAVDVTQKSFTTLVPGGLSTSPSPRFDGAMAIAGGAAVLFGGRNCIDTGDSLGDTWEFDLASNTWAAITPAGTRPSPRRAASMVSDASGSSLYMVGGYRNPFYSNEVWRYAPATNTWTQLPAAPVARAWAGATTQTVTGELWVCGGRASFATTECQAFNPTAGSWSAKPSLPAVRSEFPMAFDPFTETLYAFGGRASDATPFGDLLVLTKGASAWQSVIPPGATPAPRYGHVMYFDLTRRMLVVALGLTRDPATLRTTRLGDVWTYDGQAWTERGAAPAVPGYSVGGQITGGPANGTAQISLGTTSGFFTSTAAALDAQGRGTYTVTGVPPGELILMTVVGEDFTLPYPNTFWTYTEAQLPGLAADVTRNINLPPGPAVLLQATGSYQIPASWRGQVTSLLAAPELDAPSFPNLSNGLSSVDDVTHQFSLAFTATAAPQQQLLDGYVSSELLCEDHGLHKPIGSGTVSIPLSAPVTGMSPGQAECIPQGSRGVGPARIRASATAAQRVSVADLDGDTLPELIIPQPTRSNLGLLWGTPSVIAAFTDFTCCDVNSTHSAATGDFNKDGRLDLAVTEPATNSVKVLLASSTTPRTFQPSTAYPVGSSPSGLAVADVNGDGFQDLIVANQGDSTVSLLYGAANGTFSSGPLVTLAGTSPSQVLVTNVDGDTLPDLVVLVAEGISLARDGSTQGPFGNSTLVTAGSQPSAVVVGRLNGDTLPDLAVANAGSNSVSLLFGAGGGTFGAPVNISGVLAPAGLALAELTGDTHLDLAVASPTDASVTLLQGASNGTFTPHSKVSVPGDPRGLAVADFNGDGLNDLVVASPTANGVYLLLGQRPAPTSPGTVFSFNAPADAGFIWSMHRINGQRRYWDYYAPVQPGPVSYSLPLPSTLAPSAAPVAPSSGKVELAWTPWVRQWEPSSARPFNPRQYSLANMSADADTEPGASHYFWP